MKLIKIPTKRPGKKLKLNVRKLRKIFLMLLLVGAVAIGLIFAIPWAQDVKEGYDQKQYSDRLADEIAGRGGDIKSAEPAEQYAFYSDKATQLMLAERYDEAEAAYLAIEKTGYLATDPLAAAAYYSNLGVMYEQKGDTAKAHEQYLRSKEIREKLDIDASDKRIMLEEIDLMIERTQ